MLVATQSSANQFWGNIKADYEKTASIGMILNEMKEATSPHTAPDAKPIEFSKESFLQNIDFESINPEDVFEYINFEKAFIDDEDTDIGLNYWKDENASFSWDFRGEPGKRPKTAQIVYELATGGPNIHLVFYHDLIYPVGIGLIFRNEDFDQPDTEFTKSQYEFHWWSPLYVIDVTKDAVAQECLNQIEDQCADMFNDHYEDYIEKAHKYNSDQ